MDTRLSPVSGLPARQAPGARWLLIAATLLSVALWYIPGAEVIAYPIRFFTTIVHEGGHALATLLSGGGVERIAVHPDTSGITLSLGGWPFLVYMAGYVGATLFGAACLLLGRRAGSGRGGLVLMAALVLLITGLWMRPIGDPSARFGFAMGLVVAGTLLCAARFLAEPRAAFLFAFLSVQLCLNALLDVRNLVWMTTHTRADNDAVFMAQAYGLAPWFWAFLWAGCALAILWVALRAYWQEDRPALRAR